MTYDYIEEHDILNIKLRSGKVDRTLERPKTEEEECPSILVDVDSQGKALNIEILGASHVHPKLFLDVLREFGLELQPAQVA